MSNNKITTYLQLHLFELKYNFFILLITFFYLFIVSYYFSNQLIYLFINILINKDLLKYFIFTNITEIFITNIFISFFVSFFLIFQLSMIQSWFFFSLGLFKYENFKIVKIYLIFLIFNFFIISIILIKIINNIWYFFLNINF
jgi:Sec-independent protein secretion pathway component TatC